VRTLTAILLPCLLIACGQQPRIILQDIDESDSVDSGDDTNESELPDDGLELELPFDTTVGDESSGDSSGDTASQLCADSMKPWMCDDRGCTEGFFCNGYFECDRPPCWGPWCDYVPGTCVPAVSGTVCTAPRDCREGHTCVAGTFSISGICRALPVPGTCWSNDDCEPFGMCAGEVRCHVGNPCLGPEMPGVCVEKINDGRCWDDGMCVSGWCRGAVLCSLDDDGCEPSPGICEAGDGLGCPTTDGGLPCSASDDGNWCVGPENLNYCAMPPASPQAAGECWTDSDCFPKGGILCRSALTCPPRSFCRLEGMHSGICGQAPPDGQGIELRFVQATTTGQLQPDSRTQAVLVNRGPVAIFIAPCDTISVMAQRNGEWPGITLDWTFSTPECYTGIPESTLLRIPPGSGAVLSVSTDDAIDQQMAGRNIRLSIRYLLGCVPGKGTDDRMDCLEASNGLARTWFGDPVFWPAGGT